MGSLHLVGGEKGGVGKSVVSRLLCQFFIDQQRPFRAFDADASHPALLRYYADYAQLVDIRDFESLDALLMTALENAPVVVDLPAQSARPLSRWLDESGVADVAAESGVRVVRWHVMNDGKDSLQLLEPLLAEAAEAVDFVIVRNHGCGQDFRWMNERPELAAARAAGARVVDLPALHAPTMRKIDRIDASFWAAANNAQPSAGPCLNLLERQRVRTWLRRAQDAVVTGHPSLQLATRGQAPDPGPPQQEVGAGEHDGRSVN